MPSERRQNWLNWLPVPLTMLIIAVMGVLSNCSHQRFDELSGQLKVTDQRTFEMNTRISRIEGKLEVGVDAPISAPPPADIGK